MEKGRELTTPVLFISHFPLLFFLLFCFFASLFLHKQPLRRDGLFYYSGAVVLHGEGLAAFLFEEDDGDGVFPGQQGDAAADLVGTVEAVVVHHEAVADVDAAAVVGGGIEGIGAVFGDVDEPGEAEAEPVGGDTLRERDGARDGGFHGRELREVGEHIPRAGVEVAADAGRERAGIGGGRDRLQLREGHGEEVGLGYLLRIGAGLEGRGLLEGDGTRIGGR